MDDIIEAMSKSFDVEEKCIARQKKFFPEKEAYRVVEMLATVQGKIIVSGVGSCAIAARKIVHTLGSLRLSSMYLSPTTAIHGSLGTVQINDIMILLSRGGKSEELEPFADFCNKKGAKLIFVTENENANIAKIADVVIPMTVYAESDPGNIFATGSVIVFLAIFDAIAAGLWKKMGYTEGMFAEIHPGGAVGEKLNGK